MTSNFLGFPPAVNAALPSGVCSTAHASPTMRVFPMSGSKRNACGGRGSGSSSRAAK